MQFKKGDLVKVVGRNHFHLFKLGEIVSITGYQDEYARYWCKREDCTNQYMVKDDIEIYKPQSVKKSKEDMIARLEKELEEAKKAINKAPVVNGREMIINKNQGDYKLNTIQFGCAVFSYSVFSDVVGNNTIETNPVVQGIGLNRKIASITLDSGVEISAEQCEEIMDFYNKNK